jgi:hypothetical protein
MAILKRYTQLNRSGSNHSILDAETGYITGSFEVDGITRLDGAVTASVGLELTGSSTFAAGSTFTFNGNGVFTSGLSGSLQRTSNGDAYLVAGPNVTITTNSLGQVEISGSDPNTLIPTFWFSTQNLAVYTTGSVLLRGPAGTADSPADLGTDLFFFSSGSIGSKDTAVTGTAAFGGDLVVSGGLYVETGLQVTGAASFAGSVTLGDSAADLIAVSGSMDFLNPATFQAGLSGSLTHLEDGTSYLIAGPGITIVTGTNGAVTISSTGEIETPPELYYDGVDTAATSGSLAVTGSITLATAGTGRGLLVFGGLDIGPITGSMQTIGAGPGIMSGSLLSASLGVWDGTNAAALRHEFHVVGISTDASAMFAGSYLVSSFVNAAGAQTATGATETSREVTGVASAWDVNINSNVDITVTGSAGLTVNWYAQRTKEMSISADGNRT